MDVVKSLLQRLERQDDRLAALRDGKAHLVNVNPAGLKGAITAEDLRLVFDCLDTSDEEQISTALTILKILMPLISDGDVLKVLGDSLKSGLGHQSGDVRQLCLEQFRSCAVSSMGNQAMANDRSILSRMIELLADKNMSIALAAVKTLSDFGSYYLTAAKVLLQGQPLAKLIDVMQTDDTVRYRVYDVIVNIQATSEDHLKVCLESGMVPKLISELTAGDILIRVICVATLSNMASSTHSLMYLKQSGVVDSLVAMITESTSDPMADMYMPEVVKFFGKMCHQDGPQHVLELFPQFLTTLFGLVNDADVVKKKIGIETLGFIGFTAEGKRVLAKSRNLISAAMSQMGKIMRSEGSDIRLITVNAICQLLHVPQSDQDEDVVALTIEWFQCLSHSPVDDILALCRQPFTSVKCAGFHLVHTLAGLEWGMSALVEFPTFAEFMLDRSADQNKESKDARFEAVKAIAESPHCMHVFGNNNYLKFRAYVLEGPLYQGEPVPEVAMESG